VVLFDSLVRCTMHGRLTESGRVILKEELLCIIYVFNFVYFVDVQLDKRVAADQAKSSLRVVISSVLYLARRATRYGTSQTPARRRQFHAIATVAQ